MLASRYGTNGMMIVFRKEIETNTRGLIYELLDFVDDVVDPLGCRHAVNYIHKMLSNGTGADRQLKVYEETGGDLKEVTRFIQQSFLSV